jgi:hypothetical protein
VRLCIGKVSDLIASVKFVTSSFSLTEAVKCLITYEKYSILHFYDIYLTLNLLLDGAGWCKIRRLFFNIHYSRFCTFG